LIAQVSFLVVAGNSFRCYFFTYRTDFFDGQQVTQDLAGTGTTLFSGGLFWDGLPFFQLCCCVSFLFRQEIGFGFTYYLCT
jgi:hypothetical protein